MSENLTGRIIKQISGYYDIAVNGTTYRTRGRGSLRNDKITPLVGDFAAFQPGEGDDEGYLLKVLPRHNALVRPPVANVDQAVLITSAVEPDFSKNLLDRFLVYLEGHDIYAEIYLTKTDLTKPQRLTKIRQDLAGYTKIGYPVFAPDKPFDPTILAQVQASFADKLTIFTGQTGAGKSTLLNHLVPGLDLATAAISHALNRGRHTTRTTDLYPIHGGLVADTPGFSSYETFDMTVEELPSLFPEMRRLAPECKFRGCLHLKEPGCAVKDALEHGIIMKSRYDDYVQFHDIIVHQKPNYKK